MAIENHEYYVRSHIPVRRFEAKLTHCPMTCSGMVYRQIADCPITCTLVKDTYNDGTENIYWHVTADLHNYITVPFKFDIVLPVYKLVGESVNTIIEEHQVMHQAGEQLGAILEAISCAHVQGQNQLRNNVKKLFHIEEN